MNEQRTEGQGKVTAPATTTRAAGTIDLTPVVNMVLDSVNSEHTKTAYKRALTEFIAWYTETAPGPLSKAVVQRYASELKEAGKGSSDINIRLSAIRKLANEAGDNALLPAPIANGIARVKGVRQEGRRTGNWLTLAEAQALIDAPDVSTLKGLRDRALLAVLIGCGLRRSEAAGLTFDHLQQRDGRWVIVDLVGKREKVRSVPMPSWCKAAIDAWTRAAGITSGRVFRSVSRHGAIGEAMGNHAVGVIVGTYGARIGQPNLAAHDLRRTFAKLAHKGGAALEQIQLSLGHGTLATTERYLGVEQDLTDAPCDVLGLRLAGK